MQDAITAVINSSDVQGKYLDISALDKLKNYFASGELRVRAATAISANAATIVKEAVAKSLLYSDVTRPGGNMYTTRRYAACIRDLDYYLRYATYAMLAGDPSILDERVLNGCQDGELVEYLLAREWLVRGHRCAFPRLVTVGRVLRNALRCMPRAPT